jgi:DNA-binding transcriptional LysR family regulator
MAAPRGNLRCDSREWWHAENRPLLTVFNPLLIEHRVSKIAETLDVSQPAVSNALARLGKLLG